MSLTLTTSVRPPQIPIIDLTGDESLPYGGGSSPWSGAGSPPKKRLKFTRDPDDVSEMKQLLSRCLRVQVNPLIRDAVRRFARNDVDKELLFNDIAKLVTTREFTEEFRRCDGDISIEYELKLAREANYYARVLSTNAIYRLSPIQAKAADPQHEPPEVANGASLPDVSHRDASQLPEPLFQQPPAALAAPAVLERSGGQRSSSRELSKAASNKESDTYMQEEEGGLDNGVDGIGLSPSSPEIDHGSSPPRPRTPPPRRAKTKLVPTSPQNFRSRARAQKLRSQAEAAPAAESCLSAPRTDRYRHLAGDRRPYLLAEHRNQILQASQRLITAGPDVLEEPSLLHVDFSPAEIKHVSNVTKSALRPPVTDGARSPWKDLAKLSRKNAQLFRCILQQIDRAKLKGRSDKDIRNFLADASQGQTSKEPRALVIERDIFDKQDAVARSSRISTLLFAREIGGQRISASPRGYINVENEIRKCIEDGLELRAEWTNLAGDISTIVWSSNNAFICGTTAHSDSRNQQYNKPGNLVLGSTALGTLKAYPDHRAVRPVVNKGENSTDAMRQSQDPWLYTSVVSSDYDVVHDRAFTSGFDKTAKIWKVDPSGSSMTSLGTWQHSGNVNFVVASKHPSGMVATAADVPLDAVRVYRINYDSIQDSPYRSYSCSRIVDSEGNPVLTDIWAYFPAAIRWGLAESVKHLLLVGYSPRSLTGDDNDIPEDRRHSGEICLWNGLTGERWKLTGGTVQNVFEVAWHPSQPSFIVAASPKPLGVVEGVRTQIRIFRPSDNKEFGDKALAEIQVLDCTAVDINELAILPNSVRNSYIAAGCTDGKTYIWDTAQGDTPVHVLSHGRMVEEQSGNVISVEDTGVKFVAWGTSPDRLYTGSSDGVVKVWNVRSLNKPLVRDLLECPASVSFGAFSPDFSKLVVGDASGRVFVLSVDEDENSPLGFGSFTTVKLPDGSTKTVRRPRPFLPHAAPTPPSHDAGGNAIQMEGTAITHARAYLQSGRLELNANPTIGAVQGSNYAETNLFCREAHLQRDPALPLVATFEAVQQVNAKMFGPTMGCSSPSRGVKASAESEALHRRNLGMDLNIRELSPETLLALEVEGVDLSDTELDYGFQYEEQPKDL